MPNRLRGFTLIELMVTLAIAAILMAIAIPSYSAYLRKGRRSSATACLVEVSQYMERYYTTHMSYADATVPTLGCASDLDGYYRFAFASSQPTATSFVVEAVPEHGQDADECGTLSLSNTNVRTPTSPSSCWPK